MNRTFFFAGWVLASGRGFVSVSSSMSDRRSKYFGEVGIEDGDVCSFEARSSGGLRMILGVLSNLDGHLVIPVVDAPNEALVLEAKSSGLGRRVDAPLARG